MTFMPWTDELLVGIKEIDEQHHWLVDRANALHDEISRPGHDPHVVGTVLEELMDYTMNHFIVEEELFHRLGYPETDAHKALHDRFTAQIMELLQRHEGGDLAEMDTLNLLKDWLLHHILKVDKAYVSFFRENGVS